MIRESVVEAMAQAIAKITGGEWESYLVEAEAALDAALDVLEGSAASWEEAEDGGEIEHIDYSLLDLIKRLRAERGSDE